MLSYEEALAKMLTSAKPIEGVRSVPLVSAVGRVLAVSQRSVVAVPPHDNSAMDGYAVRVSDVKEIGHCLPISQRIPAGSIGSPLQSGTAARIFTGAPVPLGADAVVVQERCAADSGVVIFKHVPTIGENIRRAGEDIAISAEILSAGCLLRPQDIALAASAGISTLPVYRRLRVGVFFSGDELIQPGESLPPGGIYDSNRYAIRTFLERMGCEVQDLGNVPDNLQRTREVLRRAAAANDLIITSGGVSVGDEDHIRPALEAEGHLDIWKLAIKPGKPLAFGGVRRDVGNSYFIGLPGNPVSAIVTFLVMVRPFVLHAQGVKKVAPRGYMLGADFDWHQPDIRAEFLRGRINDFGRVELFANQGAGILSSLCWGDGLVFNPPSMVINRGDLVRFVPFSEMQ